MATESVQDYLKAVYVLQSYGQEVTTSRIAARLGVAAPSVSAMVKKLVADGLARHAPYREVRLTEEGEAAALAVVRRHRLVESYLHDALGLRWDEIHDEAEILEHSVSERVVDAMDRALGHPSRDPHGDPIPPKRGRHREVPDEPLAGVPIGARVRVERVSDQDAAVLRHLARLRVVPGAEVTVADHDPFGGPLWVRVGSRRPALGAELVSAIFVSVLDR
ncbi:MAG TPA: metal-dependent transcriptional regulator [Acidimicrobiales bacterium]|nr:metal-dependent transcriptional regulator [Acidimicrobiales bacterium]